MFFAHSVWKLTGAPYRTVSMRSRGGVVVMLPMQETYTTVPEKQPLKTFVSLQFVFKAKDILTIVLLEKVEQLGASLHDGERRSLCVVD
jgi:hypothetical protein